MEHLRSQLLCKGPSAEEKNLMSENSELLAREEMIAKQRSRVQWLTEGDRNTGFFQTKAKERARVNKIKSLKTESSQNITAQSELETTAKVFYQTLFTA